MTHQARTMKYLIKCKENRELTINDLTNKIDKLNKMLIEVKKEHSDLVDEINIKKEQKEKGPLAEVSIYEFVNDWVRPEISWHIFSYLAEDPHKKGVKNAQKERRVFIPSKRYIQQGSGTKGRVLNPNFKKGYGKWVDSKRDENGYFNVVPYNRIYWYCDIGKPYYHSSGSRTINNFEVWTDAMVCYRDEQGGVFIGGLKSEYLRYTNPLLAELWRFHSWRWNSNGNKKFYITKKEIKEYLKMNKVKGRGNLVFGVKCSDDWGDINWTQLGECKIPSEHRRALVSALMKI